MSVYIKGEKKQKRGNISITCMFVKLDGYDIFNHATSRLSSGNKKWPCFMAPK